MHLSVKKYGCNSCAYSTNRYDNFQRHNNKFHTIHSIVSSLLSDIVYDAVDVNLMEAAEENCLSEHELARKEIVDSLCEYLVNEVVEVSGLSEYQLMRRRNILEQRMLLSELFGGEFQGILSSSMETEIPVNRPVKKKANTTSVATRKSNRIASNYSANDPGDKSIAGDENSTEMEVNVVVSSGDDARKHIEDEDGSGLMEIVVAVGSRVMEMQDCQNMLPVDTDSSINDCDMSVSASNEETAGLGKFGCVPCQKTFRDNPNLQRHVRLVHLPRSDPIQCTRTWCNQEFLILEKMTTHRDTCFLHCPHASCNKYFTKVGRYEMHLRGHLSKSRRMSD